MTRPCVKDNGEENKKKMKFFPPNGSLDSFDFNYTKTDNYLNFNFIFKNDTIRLNKTYGFQTYDSLVPIKKHHLYDLASVTKVLASTLAFMKLYELYNIDLDQKVAAYVPSLKRSNKKK